MTEQTPARQDPASSTPPPESTTHDTTASPVVNAEAQAPLTGLAAKKAQEQLKAEQDQDKASQRRSQMQGKHTNLPPQPKPKNGSHTEANGNGNGNQAHGSSAQPPAGMSGSNFGIPMAVPTMGNPTIQQMILQLFNQNRLPGQEFHLVAIPEDDWPRIESFGRIEELIDRIRELLDKPCHLFPFVGNALGITKGPNHHLRTPYGMFPLFQIPRDDEVEDVDHGWVGPTIHRYLPPNADEDQLKSARQQPVQEAEAGPPPPLSLPAGNSANLMDTPMFETQQEKP